MRNHKGGREKQDYKGFESIVRSVRAAIAKHGQTNILYLKGSGFTSQRSISEKNKLKLKSGEAEMVGTYAKGVATEHIIEDLVFVLGQIIDVDGAEKMRAA